MTVRKWSLRSLRLDVRPAHAAIAGDVDLNIALIDNVVEVRHDKDLAEVLAESLHMLDEAAPPIEILASEDFVENDEAGLSSSLTRERTREGDAETEVRKILLA